MRSIDGAVRFSVWDDWELLEEYDTSNVRQAAYLQGAHGVVKSLVNNIYYYQDKLGSTDPHRRCPRQSPGGLSLRSLRDAIVFRRSQQSTLN
jgi:hypothetical protein